MTRNETFNGLREFKNAGHYFELLSTVNPVDVHAYAADGTTLHSELQVQQGYYIDRRGLDPFDRVEITTGGNEAVKFSITDGISGQKLSSADVSDRAGRLLGIVYGTLGQLVQRAVGAVNALVIVEKRGATLANVAEATVGVAEGVVVAAAASRLSIRFRAPATNTDNITLGAAGITVLTGCVVLAPGDFYLEVEGAAAAWSAISGTAGQKLRIQTVDE